MNRAVELRGSVVVDARNARQAALWNRTASRLTELAALGHPKARRLCKRVLAKAIVCIERGSCPPKLAHLAALISQSMRSGSRAASLPGGEVGAAPAKRLSFGRIRKMPKRQQSLLVKLRAIRRRYNIVARR